MYAVHLRVTIIRHTHDRYCMFYEDSTIEKKKIIKNLIYIILTIILIVITCKVENDLSLRCVLQNVYIFMFNNIV